MFVYRKNFDCFIENVKNTISIHKNQDIFRDYFGISHQQEKKLEAHWEKSAGPALKEKPWIEALTQSLFSLNSKSIHYVIIYYTARHSVDLQLKDSGKQVRFWYNSKTIWSSRIKEHFYHLFAFSGWRVRFEASLFKV